MGKRWIASQTLAAIDKAICDDRGNKFKAMEAQVLPHMTDAYRQEDGGYRSHLGASVIGKECERSIFYAWRWVSNNSPRGKKHEPASKAESRMRRLWNRGHLEEGRFIAMLLAANIAVYQQNEKGTQLQFKAFNGHFSGSCDAVLQGVPDLPVGVPCLGEFKTHSDKSFEELKDDGVQKAKPDHYIQMQEYMEHFGLLYALYLAVNKNTEELHAEIVMYDKPVAQHFLERARRIVFADAVPDRIRGANPGFFTCKYMCDFADVCYGTIKPARNCRTCQHAFAMPDGTWQCALDARTLDKEDQQRGCDRYQLADMFKKS